MTPRRYRMSSRAADVAERRTHIIGAAIDLFAEQTAASTNMEDVARAAGVAPATVYRQFGDFEGLAQACAETAFHITEVPTPEVAVAQFAELDSMGAKLARFVEISCECYERAQAWLAAERRERHLPAFARTVEREESALRAIVTGLLAPVGADDPVLRSVITTLVDFPFWLSLKRAGVPEGRIAGVVYELAASELRRAGIEITHTDERKPGHAISPDERPRRPSRRR